MVKITYKGPADIRVLTAADLKVDGFEDTQFLKNESMEVSELAAEKLLSKPKIYGRFIRTPDHVEAQDADTSTEPPSPDSTSQRGVDSPAGETAATSRKKS